MDEKTVKLASEKLESFKKHFPTGQFVLVNGVETPHVLKKVTKVEFDNITMKKTARKGRRKKKGQGSVTSNTVQSGSTSSSAEGPRASLRPFWNRIFRIKS